MLSGQVCAAEVVHRTDAYLRKELARCVADGQDAAMAEMRYPPNKMRDECVQPPVQPPLREAEH